MCAFIALSVCRMLVCLSDGCSENTVSVLNDDSCSQTSSQTSCPAHAHIIQPWPLSSGRCLYHRPGTRHKHCMKTVVCAPVKSLLPHAYIWVMAVSSCLPQWPVVSAGSGCGRHVEGWPPLGWKVDGILVSCFVDSNSHFVYMSLMCSQPSPSLSLCWFSF